MTIIETLQADAVARLNSDSYFADVSALAVDAGMVASDEAVFLSTLNQKGGKTGACVVVYMPSGSPAAVGVAAPVMNMSLRVHVMESPELNRATGGTGKTAEAIAMRAIQILNAWMPEGATVMRFVGFEPAEHDDGIIGYVGTFEIVIGADEISKCGIPTIASGGGLITLTGGAGESVYYTLDGTYPWAGNASAALYSTPFAEPAVGTVIRWAAYKTGKVGSDAGKATIT